MLDYKWFLKIFFEVICSLLMVCYYLLKSMVEFFYVSPKDLSQEVVLLTGAAGGFGSLIAEKLAKKGCTLILIDVNGEKVNKIAQNINNQSNCTIKAYPFSCDITNSNKIENLAREIVELVGSPTMIINNAGTLAGKYFEELTLEDVQNTFNVNSLSHYSIVKRFLPHMLEINHGHIVSISSILAVTPAGGLTDYAASKAAATAFMHALRQEIRMSGKDKVFCTNILPFQAHTQLFKGCESRFPNFPFMSVQDPEYVTDKIIEAIEKNQVTMYVPRILYVMCGLYHILPATVFDVIYDFFSVNSAMKTHVGRKKHT